MTKIDRASVVAAALLALAAPVSAAGIADAFKDLAVIYDCRLTVRETVPIKEVPGDGTSDCRRQLPAQPGGTARDFGNVPPPGAAVSCSGRGTTDPVTGKPVQRTVYWFRVEVDLRILEITSACGGAPDCRPAGGLVYSGNVRSADRSSPEAYIETVVSARADPNEGLEIGLTSAWDDTADGDDGFRVGKSFVRLPLDAPRISVKSVLRGRSIADVGLPVETELTCARRPGR